MFLGLCQTFLPRVHWGGLHDKPKESRCGRLHRLKGFPPSAYSSSVYQKSMMDTIIHFWVLSFLTFQFRFSNSLLEVPVGEDIRDLKIRWQWQQQECQKSNRFNNQNNNFAFASHFLYTTTMWKCLISRFTEEVYKRQQNFLSLSELGYGS